LPQLKTVYQYSGSWDIGTLQTLYLHKETWRLRPNVMFVRADGSTFFEINEAGLKGETIDLDRRLAVVWGDSVVFGVGPGWPCLLDALAPGYQFLNGGIEGDGYRNILARMTEFNRQQAVALNILLPGWHPHRNNASLAADFTAAIETTPNVMLATMPTALNAGIINDDLSGYFSPRLTDWTKMYLSSDSNGPENLEFFFCGSFEYSVEMQKEVFGHILERNDIIRAVAAAQSIPLIDLFGILATGDEADFRADFFDVMHPRPSAYPKVARAVCEAITHLL
jgi:hypothetical protein